MKYEFTINLTCEDSDIKKINECHNKVMDKLESKFNCLLWARTKTSNVHGGVTINHKAKEHYILVEFYEKTEKNKVWKTKFVKHDNIPSHDKVKHVLEEL